MTYHFGLEHPVHVHQQAAAAADEPADAGHGGSSSGAALSNGADALGIGAAALSNGAALVNGSSAAQAVEASSSAVGGDTAHEAPPLATQAAAPAQPKSMASSASYPPSPMDSIRQFGLPLQLPVAEAPPASAPAARADPTALGRIAAGLVQSGSSAPPTLESASVAVDPHDVDYAAAHTGELVEMYDRMLQGLERADLDGALVVLRGCIQANRFDVLAQ